MTRISSTWTIFRGVFLAAGLGCLVLHVHATAFADGNKPTSTKGAGDAAAAAQLLERISRFDPDGLRLAIDDLTAGYPEKYQQGKQFAARLEELRPRLPELAEGLKRKDPAAIRTAKEVLELQQEALLANPLLDFPGLLLVRRATAVKEPAEKDAKDPRKVRKPNPNAKLGLPQNWQGNSSLPSGGYDNEIAVLSPVGPRGKLTTLFRPDDGGFVGDVDLHFDAARLMFSKSAPKQRWQVYEIGVDGQGLRQVTPGGQDDVDQYDPCYLPDDRVIFTSTAHRQGVPCVGGSSDVANLALLDSASGKVRLLTYEQDHDWCPTLLPSGRVLYTRWEYTDTAHYFTRLLFSMNPDGTNQMEHYGSNSYWPNGVFYARPIPGSSTKLVGIVSGHHGVPRMGELVIFDPAMGRTEASGAVQRIPGRGLPVPPTIADGLVNGSWPRFLHPYPLSEKYFLVSCQLSANSPWAIYLADVFDNLVPLCQLEGNAMLEPIPLRPTPRPAVVPDRVRPDQDQATVYMVDVYRGPGLKGIPRGTVKSLRLMEYSFCYHGVGGHDRIGVESSWDVKRVIGSVPVDDDGSALFYVPANTPVAVQPLDAEGRALQLMRSWFTAMPGETLSCVGCHESQNTVTPNARTVAAGRKPSMPEPWYGPTRGFSFLREVQPVLDRYCAGCHDGKSAGAAAPNLCDTSIATFGGRSPRSFPQSYLALHPYVRRPGPESDYHLPLPMEYHASTSELIQDLSLGHHGVKLDREAWDRLYTWIDLNAPCYGTWTEAYSAEPAKLERIAEVAGRRSELAALFGAPPKNCEEDARLPMPPRAAWIKPESEEIRVRPAKLAGWPMTAAVAQRLQEQASTHTRRTIQIADGVDMEMVLIPAGQFVMGDLHGLPNERPQSRVKIPRPFWMSVCEVSNAQYKGFDPSHSSGFIDQQWKDHATPGYPADQPSQPAIRVTWQEATSFCEWLSRRTGAACMLPSEAEWEWACRAGSDTPLWFGPVTADFSSRANLADVRMTGFAVRGVNPKPVTDLNPLTAFLPHVDGIDDGQMIEAPSGTYAPNPWGLRDMHGNVAEWTRSLDRPYPYDAQDGRESAGPGPGRRIVRGGSWRDRPQQATSAARQAYEPYQPVFDVGFRVLCQEGP